MDYQITADSTCDLSDALLQEYSIQLIPLTIHLGNDSFQDRVDIFPEQVFSCFSETGEVGKTAAPSIETYRAAFESLLKQGKKVLHVSLSSYFSSSYQSARLAAEELGEDHVFVVDSLNLSTGSGHVALRAAELARTGIPLGEVAQRLRQEVVPKVEASFVISDLTYLHRGGRCSSVAKLGANLLKLKPCIEVVDGKMHVGRKYRGDYDKCVLEYVTNRLRGRNDLDDSRIFITHTTCEPSLTELVKQAIEREASFSEILITDAGCTISTHCGPETLGILFLKK